MSEEGVSRCDSCGSRLDRFLNSWGQHRCPEGVADLLYSWQARAERAEAEAERLKKIALELAEGQLVHRREWYRAKIEQREPRPVRCSCCPPEAKEEK